MSEDDPRARRLRLLAYAFFVPAGLLAAAAVYTMYEIGTSPGPDRDRTARLGLLFTSLALVLVVIGALVRERVGRKDPE